MPKRRKSSFTLRSWLKRLFRQPPQGLYQRPAVYQSRNRIEIEHFTGILFYDESRLCVQFPQGRYTIFGDRLKILCLTRHRITLCGTILRTDYSND